MVEQNGKTYKTLIDTNVDILFIVTDKLDTFLIPIKNISNKSTLNLCDKYSNYRVSINY